VKKDRLTKERCSSGPRPSDGRGIKGEGKDRLSRERRSWNMSRIRGKDTTPEKFVRSLLHRIGYRFRLHVRIPIVSSPQRRRDAERNVPKGRRGVESPLSASTGKIPSPLWGEGGRRPDEVRRTDSNSSARVRCRTPRAVSVDILLPKYKTAIFIHGCFWHRHAGCRNCTTPTNRRDWWLAKLNGNAARDKLHQARLRKLGWRVVVIWECETGCERCAQILRQQLPPRRAR
jgi:DNA mismatch endonuclease Vsr